MKAEAATPAAPAPASQYRKGDDVYIYYRMDKRCDSRRKYMAVLDPRHGAYRPRMGLSDGWVPARVTQDQVASNEQVPVQHLWPHFATNRGHFVTEEDMLRPELHRLSDLRPASSPPKGLVDYECQPELAIIAFRWGGLQEITVSEQWGETGSSVSDQFIVSFLDRAVMPELKQSCEVWTVYVEDHSDMVKLADTAHLVFGPNHPSRRARHIAAMYFLYPTPFEENCVPTMETGGDGGAALVDQKSFFRMMKAMERAGIPTRFPHCSGLYEQLASKSWTHVLALAPHLRVPPTVAVPRMAAERSCHEAAKKGLASLKMVKQQQALLRGEEATQGDIAKGVVKLGFSWEALDVKCWVGEAGLREALHQLTQNIDISDELTGQPHDCQVLLLQEFVPHDLELRVYVVEGKVEGMIYTKFCSLKPNNEFGDFKQLFDKAQAAKQWMGGDSAALADGERQCRELTSHWLHWVEAQCCEMPPAIRFDYFVSRVKGSAGKASVWTLEICELGFSMLGEPRLPDKVFAAMLRSCLEGEECRQKLLPVQLPGNAGSEAKRPRG